MSIVQFRHRHWALNLWPYQSLNVPLGKHRILIVARGKLGPDSVFHPWWIQAEIMQLYFCCGRNQRAADSIRP